MHDPKFRDLIASNRFGRESDIGLGLNVLMKDFSKIHSVELVAAQNEKIIERALEEVAHVLPDGIGRSLVPLRALGSLLSGEYVDETAGEIVELVAGLDMSMERHAVELGQHVNGAQPGIQAVTDRDIDDAIFSAERDGRFRAIFG